MQSPNPGSVCKQTLYIHFLKNVIPKNQSILKQLSGICS